MRSISSRQIAVYKELRENILGGRYVSVRFPSERSLAMRFKVSRSTITRCLSDLEREGLVTRSQGRGTFITRQGLSRKIGLIVPGLVSYSEYFQPIVSEMTHLAQTETFDLRLGNICAKTIEARTHEVRELAAEFIRHKVSGIIYQPLEYVDGADETNERILSVFSRAKIPVVLIDSDILPPPARSRYDCVAIDNVDAGERIANHLYERGAKNIHFFMLPELLPTVAKRMRGVICSAILHGHKWSQDNVVAAQPDDKTAIRRLFRRRSRPDAFVCENDMVAGILLQTLTGLGIRVPDDVMLAGFDDMQCARMTSPALTTIHQPCAKIAETAFRRLINRIARPDLPIISILLPAPLVVRGSTDRVVCKGKLKNLNKALASAVASRVTQRRRECEE